MADLVVGLSKTVVEGALARVRTAIKEEAKLRQKAQRDLKLISMEFEMIQSFLNMANDEMSTTKNHLRKTWVNHVRELANDLEDCIEFVVDLDGKPVFWRRLLPSCIAPVLPLDQAVTEIEELKGRAKELSKCYMRYSHISESAASKVVVLQGQVSSRLSSAAILREARDTARRKQAFGDLTQLITNKENHNDPRLRVISVWGTAGDIGITSVIMKAYTDPEICQYFACRVWVKLMNPFDPQEFVHRFMAQVYTNACNKQGSDVAALLMKMNAGQEQLLTEFLKEVKTKTYLVVLENLTDMVDWEAVRMLLPDMENGSWIIVSTQQLETASLCIGHRYQPLELKQFTPDHSVCAFFKESSQDYGDKYSTIKAVTAASDWMIINPLSGRRSQLIELCNYTAKPRFSTTQVISIWGIAGIGKSALVRNMYYDRMINTNQFKKYRWVDVSRPFNLRDFSRSILLDSLSEKEPIQECRQLLKQHRCLVVIDDVQSKEEWDLMQATLVSRDCASLIIVITTDANIATYCTNDEQVFNVKGLEAAAAFDLFRKEVKKKNPLSPLNDHKDVELDELILKCGGLPAVIVALASVLAERSVTLMDTVRSMNQRFMDTLETNPEFDSLRGLLGWMYSYFRDCPDSLKPCIFYLSIFPQDQNIRRRRLIRRWIAEGYSKDSDELSAEEKGEKFFSDLLELSIIQQLPQLVTTTLNDTRMILCQVNGFIREYIVSWRTKENLVFELGRNSVVTNQCTERHLIILRSWDRDRIVFESINFSRIRSLTVFGKWESFFISKSMRLLLVLDLEDASGVRQDDLSDMFKLLRRLRFLSLRGQSEIFYLPSSLGGLTQLQSLDVRHTSIVTLPKNIASLNKLQYIRSGAAIQTSTPQASCSWSPRFHKYSRLDGIVVPSGISELTALHTLGVINIGASGGKNIVKEIEQLTQLRKLGVSGINRHNCKEFFCETSSLVHLESLSVQLDKDNQDCLDGMSLPWENLKSIKLYGLQDKLPLSRTHLNELRKLELEMDTLMRNDIEFLANLPELCILRLRVKQLEDDKLDFYVEKHGEPLYTFKKVKILEIACIFGQSLMVVFGSRTMKNLELLKVDCSSASYQLNGLNYLFELKQVLLKGADEEIKTALEKQLLENHPERAPAVKLEELPHSS